MEHVALERVDRPGESQEATGGKEKVSAWLPHQALGGYVVLCGQKRGVAIEPLHPASQAFCLLWLQFLLAQHFQNFFLSEPVAFRLVYGLESHSRTSGESNEDTRVPPYQLHHEDDSRAALLLEVPP